MRSHLWFWLPPGVSMLAGLVATLASGWLRDLCLIFMHLAGLALVWRVATRSKPASDDGLGGPGYQVAIPPPVRTLHAIITVSYTVGLMVVVFAALVRFDLVQTHLSADLVQGFPLLLGLYLLLLALAAMWKEESDGLIATWYTRVHGGVVAVMGGLFLLAGILVMARIGSLQTNDLPVLVLVGYLGVGTQMMFTTGLPTTFDLIISALRSLKPGAKQKSAATPPIVYAGLLSIAVGGLITFLAWRFDVLGVFGGFGSASGVYFIAIIPAVLASFFAVSALAVWREGRRGIYQKKLSTKLRNDLMVYGGSALAGLISAVVLVQLMVTGSASILGLRLGAGAEKDLIAFTVIVTTGPIGYYLHKQHQRTDHIETRMPDFLNDLAESRRSGLTLPAALRAATRADYGALTPEIQKMADQVAWGVGFNDALQQFSDRIKTPLVQRSTNLVIEASRTGGSVAEILKAAARDIAEIKGIERDRKVTMATYLIVIYVVFFVFLMVLGALDAKFIPEILRAGQATAQSDVVGVTYVQIDPDEIRFVYFNAAMVQSIGNGLVGGVLTEGRVTSGFRHVAIMALASWVVFRLFLGL